MLLNLENYGEIVMAGAGFLKVLEGKLPNANSIRPKVLEVANWIIENVFTEDEKQDVRNSGILD
jgi:hypothetical protein